VTKKKIVIITGLSGSGKSTVAKTLEDLGFFCVDNLPLDLVPKLLELADSRGGDLVLLALVIDARQRQLTSQYSDIFAALQSQHLSLDILFLESRDQVLVRRYSETRRQHPLAEEGNVLDGIGRERALLEPIRDRADWVIDTSDMTVHQLREEVKSIFQRSNMDTPKVILNSFGFGKGVPLESDLVLDVRFLPNPYFVENLRFKDGRDSEVASFVLDNPITKQFLEKLDDLIIFLMPLYIKEGKQYLTISIGCTGGRHRSVVVAQHLGTMLERQGYRGVEIRHRELPLSNFSKELDGKI
jgi:RNase adapter protein RapZ